MFKKNNFKPNEMRTVVITCIVTGGHDTAIVNTFNGEQIAKIQDMMEEIMSWNENVSPEGRDE